MLVKLTTRTHETFRPTMAGSTDLLREDYTTLKAYCDFVLAAYILPEIVKVPTIA